VPVVPTSPESSPVLSLGDLQRQFVREILYRDSTGLVSGVVANGLGPERRLAIYRTNARETFALALEAAFPLLLQCTGVEEFRQLAWAYQRACPSPAGNLFHVGTRLAGFLAEHVSGTEDEYLIDVARLEWAVQESLVAADGATALDLPALALVPAERQAGIRFLLHPSVRLLRTRYAVFGPWEARQAGRPVTPAALDPECLLVRRLPAGVQLQRLASDDFDRLSALHGGESLAEPRAGQDELGSFLLRWATAGVITDFTLQDPRPRDGAP
jgi:Putative DNA-binding domain